MSSPSNPACWFLICTNESRFSTQVSAPGVMITSVARVRAAQCHVDVAGENLLHAHPSVPVRVNCALVLAASPARAMTLSRANCFIVFLERYL